MKLTLLKCGDTNSKESFVRESYFRSWERVQKMTTIIDNPDVTSGYLTAHGNLALPTQFLRDQELAPCDDQSDDEIVSQNGVYFIYNRISALLYSAENIIPSGCDFEIAMQSIYGMAAHDARDFEISTLHNELASRYFNLEESLVEGDEARFLAYS